jgi:hypothetical protein
LPASIPKQTYTSSDVVHSIACEHLDAIQVFSFTA